ncbi:MAG: bifunctional 4-hydroxy-2-oxoglutarate aldolase/2-dehydro-3-deoxy-phosphogluconate aldolase [Woeseiaceae bacterium]
MDVSNLLAGAKIVPVVVIEDAATAVELAESLLRGGIKTIEVTLRSDAAIEAIRCIATTVPDIIVGAGSISHASQVAEVVDAGAQYAVAPGHTPAILTAAEEAELPFVPGAVTPSETLRLLERGYSVQKFFPAEAAGGVDYLKSISGPVPAVSFIPTGGITAESAGSYLALKNIFALGGSWIAPKELLMNQDFASVEQRARDAMAL